MTGGFFLDTNVLVYGYDRAQPVKQARALRLMDSLTATGDGVISAQVLSELFAVLTRKLPERLPAEAALERLEACRRIWTVVALTAETILLAARAAHEFQMSIWDAQIWAAARLSGVPIVLTEDMPSGARIGGVRYVNPFAEGFRLADYVD
jgi:predicted nucleic acid-binding protein